MVNIAVAGGSGGQILLPNKLLQGKQLIIFTELAREVVDALLAANKHNVYILSSSVGIANGPRAIIR